MQKALGVFSISIHALLAESDVVDTLKLSGPMLFLSTLSLRRATPCQGPPLRGVHISIHALLAESDAIHNTQINKHNNFYPRSPCGERHLALLTDLQIRDFYPRSPCGERLGNVVAALRMWNFYPRSPCGERPSKLAKTSRTENISIHALLAESDSVRPHTRQRDAISIHALLAESDNVACGDWHKLRDFYPRSPCGERPAIVVYVPLAMAFLSTLSLRRATIIDIINNVVDRLFLSTLSLRRATPDWSGFIPDARISIHALLAESDDT